VAGPGTLLGSIQGYDEVLPPNAQAWHLLCRQTAHLTHSKSSLHMGSTVVFRCQHRIPYLRCGFRRERPTRHEATSVRTCTMNAPPASSFPFQERTGDISMLSSSECGTPPPIFLPGGALLYHVREIFGRILCTRGAASI
jgi:hypothetical protein